jgi:hypothetical protein
MPHPPRYPGYLTPDQRVAIPTEHPRAWHMLTPGSGRIDLAIGELTEQAAPLVPVGHPEAPSEPGIPPDVAGAILYVQSTLRSTLRNHRCPAPSAEPVTSAHDVLVRRLARQLLEVLATSDVQVTDDIVRETAAELSGAVNAADGVR